MGEVYVILATAGQIAEHAEESNEVAGPDGLPVTMDRSELNVQYRELADNISSQYHDHPDPSIRMIAGRIQGLLGEDDKYHNVQVFARDEINETEAHVGGLDTVVIDSSAQYIYPHEQSVDGSKTTVNTLEVYLMPDPISGGHDAD